MSAPRVLVLGAGIAGLVAAYELATRGFAVTVIEAAPMAGGRTSTYRDARGRVVDTGLHVVADHYVNLIEVLSSLGVSKHLHWWDEHLYLRAGREPLHWYFSDRRPPFHLARPFREMPVDWAARAGLVRMGLAMAAYTQEDLAALDDVRYIDWHRSMGLGDGFVRELADAAADASTFLGVEEASARPVLSWMRYMMRHKRAGDVGIWRGTLEERLIGPLVAAIEKAGGVVRTGTAVVGFDVDGGRVRGVRVRPSRARGPCHDARGLVPTDAAAEVETLHADDVVSALSVQGLAAVTSRTIAQGGGFASAFELSTVPAVSLIVWFDRKIAPMPDGAPLVSGGCAMRDFVDMVHLGRVDRANANTPGSVYQFVLTRAAERILQSDERIVADVVSDLASVWPAAAGARVSDYAIERIESAMFAARPGAHRHRPTTATRFSNFVLAGDWVRHELNASMEGAALSGRLAANAVLTRHGQPSCPIRVAPDPAVVPALRRLRQRLSPRSRATDPARAAE